jgi:hypothetical protein
VQTRYTTRGQLVLKVQAAAEAEAGAGGEGGDGVNPQLLMHVAQDWQVRMVAAVGVRLGMVRHHRCGQPLGWLVVRADEPQQSCEHTRRDGVADVDGAALLQ